MRINAGSGVSPSRVWYGDLSPPPYYLCSYPGNMDCSLDFRSGKIDQWENLKVTKVNLFDG